MIGEIVFLILALIIFPYTGATIRMHRRRRFWRERRQKLETKESLDHFTHQHSPYWAYLKDIIPWRTRLWLSRFRGKKWALTWRIKIYAFFSGLGPQVAQWLLEEYMITAKADDLPAPDDTWRCAHCGCDNVNTALFCKDCGEYK
nr:hypothetical protein [Oscillospiraceae bacterium]